MVMTFFGNYWATILIGLLATFVLLPLLTNLIIHLIFIKYKFKIKFKFKRFHQLVGVEIYRLKTTNEPNEKLFEIFIDKLWISSCYVNRQVNSRILISMNSVRIEYYANSIKEISLVDSTVKAVQNKSSFFLIYWLVQFYLKYIGSVSIEALNFKLVNLLRQFDVVVNLVAFRIEFNENVQGPYVPKLVENSDSKEYDGEYIT